MSALLDLCTLIGVIVLAVCLGVGVHNVGYRLWFGEWP